MRELRTEGPGIERDRFVCITHDYFYLFYRICSTLTLQRKKHPLFPRIQLGPTLALLRAFQYY